MRSRLLLALLVVTACAGAQRNTADSARRVRFSMAEQLAHRGDWAGAFAAADALTSEVPTDTQARLLRGVALRHQNFLTEAEADFGLVLKAEPLNPAAHAELALLLEQADRPEEALRHHREAHRLAPENPRYLNDLGFALTIHGDAGQAIPLLEEALRTDPKNPRFRNNLGFACAASGDFARAAQEFARAGGQPQARNNLGLAYERAGDFKHAYALYLEAWRLDPNPMVRSNLEHAAKRLARALPAEVTPIPAITAGSVKEGT
jgi:Flp pilus assembly protein TadD